MHTCSAERAPASVCVRLLRAMTTRSGCAVSPSCKYSSRVVHAPVDTRCAAILASWEMFTSDVNALRLSDTLCAQRNSFLQSGCAAERNEASPSGVPLSPSTISSACSATCRYEVKPMNWQAAMQQLHGVGACYSCGCDCRPCCRQAPHVTHFYTCHSQHAQQDGWRSSLHTPLCWRRGPERRSALALPTLRLNSR
jgi:hypothetical protein